MLAHRSGALVTHSGGPRCGWHSGLVINLTILDQSSGSLKEPRFGLDQVDRIESRSGLVDGIAVRSRPLVAHYDGRE